MINNRKSIIVYSLCLLITLTSILFALYVIYTNRDISTRFNDIFGLELPEEKVTMELYDDYSGVPYEGKRLYSFSFSQKAGTEIASKIKSSGSWNKLPLSEPLNILMYGGKKNYKDYKHSGFADEVKLPKVKNGYWKFINRNREKNVLHPHSWGFLLAIFDSDNNIMYYYQIDT